MSARLLLIDNYDSFTYNLVQAFEVLGAEVQVHRNDALSLREALRLASRRTCASRRAREPRGSRASAAN